MGAGHGVVTGPVERFEDLLPLDRRDTRPFVVDEQEGGVTIRLDADRDHRPGRRVLGRVGHQVGQDPLHRPPVDESGHVGGDPGKKPVPGGQRGEVVDGGGDEIGQRRRRRVGRRAAPLEPREVEEVLDDAHQRLPVAVDAGDEIAALVLVEPVPA